MSEVRLNAYRIMWLFVFFDLPPYPFFQRLARLDLRPVVLALCPVGIEIHQHGVRHPVVAAEDDGRIVIRERIQQRQRHGRLSVLQHHHPDILDRNGPLHVGGLLRTDNHLIVPKTQAIRRRKEQRAFHHEAITV